MTTPEEWRCIDGWPYSVSSYGRVRNDRTGRVLRPMTANGYHKVALCDGGRRVDEYLHRLVAFAFFPPPRAGYEVNHINGDKSDSRSENLEWVSRSTNAKHSFDIGLQHPIRGVAHGQAKLNPSAVREIRTSVTNGVAVRALARRFGVDPAAIRQALQRKTWRHVQ